MSIMPVQYSVEAGSQQRDAHTSAGTDHKQDFIACRAFKLNTDSQLLWVKLANDESAVLSWYEKGLIYPLAAVNVLKDSSGPVALTAGDVTLFD
jgi:hypothetical protein